MNGKINKKDGYGLPLSLYSLWGVEERCSPHAPSPGYPEALGDDHFSYWSLHFINYAWPPRFSAGKLSLEKAHAKDWTPADTLQMVSFSWYEDPISSVRSFSCVGKAS